MGDDVRSVLFLVLSCLPPFLSLSLTPPLSPILSVSSPIPYPIPPLPTLFSHPSSPTPLYPPQTLDGLVAEDSLELMLKRMTVGASGNSVTKKEFIHIFVEAAEMNMRMDSVHVTFFDFVMLLVRLAQVVFTRPEFVHGRGDMSLLSQVRN